MPHIITAEVRKEPRIHNERTFIVELSESYKNKDGEREYTNYTFFFNAKTDGLFKWYSEAFQVGKVVSVQCDNLKANVREHNGTTYVTLQAAGFAELKFSQFGGGQQQSAPHQQHQQQKPRQQQSAPQPQKDFDDDIPF